MKALAGVGALVAITFGLFAGMGSQRANASVGWPPTESSSRLLDGGRLLCTATVKPHVQLGQNVEVKLTLHNRSKRATKVSLWVFSAQMVVKTADGTTYDTSAPYRALPGIPPPIPRKLRAGATIHPGPVALTVRWRGPLQITPECLGKPLPTLSVGVVAPWPGPDKSAAVGQVVAAAGHLLDHCRPQTSGVPVDGQIDPPSGTAPPMQAQCSVTITSAGRFLVAQVLVLTPPGLTGVQVFQPYESLWPLDGLDPLTASPPYEAIAWEFVVTRERATPVAASSLAATNPSSSGTVPFFDWSSTGGQSGGSESCGGTGFAWGGNGPEVEFISACSA